MRLVKIMIPLVVLLATTQAGLAQQGTLVMGVAGEKFNLAPAFTVAIDGTVIGEGEVADPIDTKMGATMDSIDDPQSRVEMFEFPIEEGELAPDATLVVQFTTSDYDPETFADTNLYIASITVNGVPIDLGSVVIVDGANPNGDTGRIPGMVGLYAGGATASFAAPEGGWFATEAVEAEAAEPAPATDDAAVPETERVEAEENPAPAEPEFAACTLTTTLAVTGFGNNDTNPPDAAQTDLAELAESVAGQDCRVSVVGYSSMAGPAALNQRYSQERADAVRRVLIAAGVPEDRVVARGEGETDRFGAAADNRRVEVRVSP
ncbi:OmpA family protein [Devosia albogilva]|uniref:OmpA family protein n=1 Tax=Devosia albogilva TaxID=429726 RepID=A0ABW5QJJ9_9HYPH